jgi:hypothetical protein
VYRIQLRLIELQLDSHVQARVVEGALQGRGVRNTIAFEGCKLASQLVILMLRAQLCVMCFSCSPLIRVRAIANCMGRNCTPRLALTPTKTTLKCETCSRNDAAPNQKILTNAASGQPPFTIWSLLFCCLLLLLNKLFYLMSPARIIRTSQRHPCTGTGKNGIGVCGLL